MDTLKPLVVAVGSHLLAPTQTQHALLLEHLLPEFRFRLVAKRFGDEQGRRAPCNDRIECVQLPADPHAMLSGAVFVHALTGGRIAHHAVRLAEQHNLPVLVSFHGGKDVHETLNEKSYALAYRWICRKAACITVATRSHVARIVALGASPQTIVHIPPGVPVPRHYPGAEQRTIPLLFAARMLERKRPVLALEVAAAVGRQHPNGPLLDIVGDGICYPEVLGALERLGLHNRVQCHGLLSREDLQHLLHRTKILLFTSEPGTEGLPPIVLEAQSAGAVVVVVGGIDGVEGVDNQAAFFASREVDRAASYCLALLQSPQKWESASRQAYSYILKNFSIDMIASLWRKTYQSMIRRTPRRG